MGETHRPVWRFSKDCVVHMMCPVRAFEAKNGAGAGTERSPAPSSTSVMLLPNTGSSSTRSPGGVRKFNAGDQPLVPFTWKAVGKAPDSAEGAAGVSERGMSSMGALPKLTWMASNRLAKIPVDVSAVTNKGGMSE